MQTAKHEADGDGLGGFLSEMRIGVMAHDVGAFGRGKEEGPNVNAELLFVSPGFLELVYSPRPPGNYFFFGLDDENWRHRDECLRVTFTMPDDVVREGYRVIAEEVSAAYLQK